MRQIDPTLATALANGTIAPAIFAQLTFASGPSYAWTGYGPFAWNGNTYQGLGQLAGVGKIKEGIAVRADGTTVSLSGIDPTIYEECLTDIQVGAPAALYFGLVNGTTLIGTPYPIFAGQVDKPVISEGGDDITITLALETKMTNLQRPSERRYTTADQLIDYPDDIGFSWVELLSDISNKWA